MAKLSEFEKNLTLALQELNLNRERDAVLVTRDGIALAKLRVINTGINAEGAAFTDYSTNPLPLFWFGSGYGKNGLKALDFNVDAARDRLKKKFQALNKGKPQDQRQFASYKDWRDITGRPTDHKNFSFSGDLWASIREFVIEKTKVSIRVQIKSSVDFYNKTVIPAQEKREGINLIQLAPDERRLVNQAYVERRRAILVKHNILKP